jgi:hypothetical protein
MEYCVFCQAPLAPGEHICQNCGRMQPLAELERPTMAASNLGTLAASPCPRCGVLASAADPYCRSCGLPLNLLGDQATRTADSSLTSTPPPAPWGTSRQRRPATAAYPGSGPPGSGPAWDQGAVPAPPPPPDWARRPLPYQPGLTDPQGSLPTISGPSPGWQTGSTPFPPGRFTSPPPGVGMSPGVSRSSRRPLIITAIVLVVLLVLGGGGAAAFLLTRPNPTLSISGPTQSGSHPAGAPDNAFHVVGTGFSANSAITFFLDGQSVQKAPSVQSDGSGGFTVDLPITDDWLLGQHTLSAKDAKDYGPKNPVTVVVLAAPVLDVMSQYQQGNTPAGSAGTTLNVTGKRFALGSPVTLLLDGAPLTGGTPITSDDHGRVQAQITVGKDWKPGSHTFTAKDAQGNATKSGAAVVVVAQGVAGTPGPNGAPADNESFALNVSVSAKDTQGNDESYTQVLTITGQPDPAGGKVCDQRDNGQPQSFNGSLSQGGTFTVMIVFSCAGTYKSGHLTYTETIISAHYTLSDGGTCTLQSSFVYGQFDGTFTDATTITGTFHRQAFNAPCQNSRYSNLFGNSAQGTWTGSR